MANKNANNTTGWCGILAARHKTKHTAAQKKTVALATLMPGHTNLNTILQ